MQTFLDSFDDSFKPARLVFLEAPEASEAVADTMTEEPLEGLESQLEQADTRVREAKDQVAAWLDGLENGQSVEGSPFNIIPEEWAKLAGKTLQAEFSELSALTDEQLAEELDTYLTDSSDLAVQIVLELTDSFAVEATESPEGQSRYADLQLAAMTGGEGRYLDAQGIFMGTTFDTAKATELGLLDQNNTLKPMMSGYGLGEITYGQGTFIRFDLVDSPTTVPSEEGMALTTDDAENVGIISYDSGYSINPEFTSSWTELTIGDTACYVRINNDAPSPAPAPEPATTSRPSETRQPAPEPATEEEAPDTVEDSPADPAPSPTPVPVEAAPSAPAPSAPEATEVDTGEFIEINGSDVEDWIGNIASKYGTTPDQIAADNPGKIKTVTKVGGGFKERHIGKQYVVAGETLKIRKSGPDTTSAEPSDTVTDSPDSSTDEPTETETDTLDDVVPADDETSTDDAETPATDTPRRTLTLPGTEPFHLTTDEPAAEPTAEPATEPTAEPGSFDWSEYNREAADQFREQLQAKFPGLEVSNVEFLAPPAAKTEKENQLYVTLKLAVTYRGEEYEITVEGEGPEPGLARDAAMSRAFDGVRRHWEEKSTVDRKEAREEFSKYPALRQFVMSRFPGAHDVELSIHPAEEAPNGKVQVKVTLDFKTADGTTRHFPENLNNHIAGVARYPEQARVKALDALKGQIKMHTGETTAPIREREAREQQQAQRVAERQERKADRQERRADRIEAREQQQIDSAISKGKPIIEKIKTKLEAGKPIDEQMYALRKIADNIDDWDDYEEVLEGLGFFQKPGQGPEIRLLHIDGSKFLEANFDEEASESINLIDLGSPETPAEPEPAPEDSAAVIAQVEEAIDSTQVEPNRKFALKDGSTVIGSQVSANETSITIRRQDGETQTIDFEDLNRIDPTETPPAQA
jgi:hypothetical protein